MSDAALVAQEIQDLARSVGDVADAVRAQGTTPAPTVNVNVPEAPAPTVNVNVPEAPAPTVNVAVNVPEAPAPTVSVNVPEAPAPTVNVLPALPTSYVVRVTKRDEQGLISEFVIYPATPALSEV